MPGPRIGGQIEKPVQLGARYRCRRPDPIGIVTVAFPPVDIGRPPDLGRVIGFGPFAVKSVSVRISEALKAPVVTKSSAVKAPVLESPKAPAIETAGSESSEASTEATAPESPKPAAVCIPKRSHGQQCRNYQYANRPAHCSPRRSCLPFGR